MHQNFAFSLKLQPSPLMLKYLALAAFALVASVAPAAAQGNIKVFKGEYDGISNIETATGEFNSYSPIRVTVSKTGKITGTALKDTFDDQPDQLLQVKGKIVGKVKKGPGGFTSQARVKGTFSDGATWSGTITFVKVGLQKSGAIQGKVKWNDFSGDLIITR
jgi:hypothetical protein